MPVANSAVLSAKLIRRSKLKIYEHAPHELMVTHKDRFNGDLLDFINRSA